MVSGCDQGTGRSRSGTRRTQFAARLTGAHPMRILFDQGTPVPLKQHFPVPQPLRVPVGFAAGGPTDVIGRVLAQDMTLSMGQSVIVENRPGANAIIATDAVAGAAPDGYTVLCSSLSLLVNALLPGAR